MRKVKKEESAGKGKKGKKGKKDDAPPILIHDRELPTDILSQNLSQTLPKNLCDILSQNLYKTLSDLFHHHPFY
jgi:hypothetical protein